MLDYEVHKYMKVELMNCDRSVLLTNSSNTSFMYRNSCKRTELDEEGAIKIFRYQNLHQSLYVSARCTPRDSSNHTDCRTSDGLADLTKMLVKPRDLIGRPQLGGQLGTSVNLCYVGWLRAHLTLLW
ncbi:hypothetical protein BJX63DRAFT_364470 [Aspergillus granulosus]|uniref:Uncharacterized protein n=1 Tax=Aspergillus granulosus TaxID=176169 RepID=A0ABR4H1Q7_9EURO